MQPIKKYIIQKCHNITAAPQQIAYENIRYLALTTMNPQPMGTQTANLKTLDYLVD